LPEVRVVLYLEADESVPLFEWYDRLPKRAKDKCRVRIERLRELGHELRRPEADYLRDGIYELRAKHAAAASPKEIMRAVRRKADFDAVPLRHTYWE